MLSLNKPVETSNTPEFKCDRTIMLFELSVGGHYATYILHLINYWRKHALPGRLEIVVSPMFYQQHADVVDIGLSCEQKNINFVAISADEEAVLTPRKSPVHRAHRAFQQWQLLCKYARLLKATQCLIMYVDTFQSPLAFNLKSPCPVSGIYFRPTFHYGEFANNALSRKEKLQQWREKVVVPRVLQHSHLQTLFCLDPFAVKHMNQFFSKAKSLYLPDPVQDYYHSKAEIEKLKTDSGIETGRQVFLLFGALNERKGIHQLLQAASLLPPHLCQKMCLMLVGSISSQDKSLVERAIADVTASQPLQIITRDQYIPDQEIQPYLAIADVILAPYQRHVGMSSILVRAAAAQKPVLSSDYGLMGEIARRYRLGVTVDTTKPEAIAQGLSQFILESPEQLCDHEQMKLFAEQNTAEKFASTIFQNI